MTTGSLPQDGNRSRWDQRDKNKYCYGVLLSRRCVLFNLGSKQRQVKRKLRKLFFLHMKSYSHHKRCKKRKGFLHLVNLENQFSGFQWLSYRMLSWKASNKDRFVCGSLQLIYLSKVLLRFIELVLIKNETIYIDKDNLILPDWVVLFRFVLRHHCLYLGLHLPF